MIGLRRGATVAGLCLLTACTAGETRTAARIVMKGPAEQVLAQADAAAASMHAPLQLSPRDAQGQIEATLTVETRIAGDKAFQVMTRCIKAKLSCAFHSPSVSREVRASLG